MTPLRRRAAPRADGARAALDRAVATLRQYQRYGVATVPVGDVLELLGAGLTDGPAPPEAAQMRDPDADPLTGCRAVTAPGTGGRA